MPPVRFNQSVKKEKGAHLDQTGSKETGRKIWGHMHTTSWTYSTEYINWGEKGQGRDPAGETSENVKVLTERERECVCM